MVVEPRLILSVYMCVSKKVWRLHGTPPVSAQARAHTWTSKWPQWVQIQLQCEEINGCIWSPLFTKENCQGKLSLLQCVPWQRFLHRGFVENSFGGKLEKKLAWICKEPCSWARTLKWDLCGIWSSCLFHEDVPHELFECRYVEIGWNFRCSNWHISAKTRAEGRIRKFDVLYVSLHEVRCDTRSNHILVCSKHFISQSNTQSALQASHSSHHCSEFCGTCWANLSQRDFENSAHLNSLWEFCFCTHMFGERKPHKLVDTSHCSLLVLVFSVLQQGCQQNDCLESCIAQTHDRATGNFS